MSDRSSNPISIRTGVAYAIVLACGIIYTVLTAQVAKGMVYALELVAIKESSSIRYSSAYDLPLWVLGFSYIFPGATGLAAVIVRNKCAHITAIVSGVLTMIAMGIFFILMFVMMGATPLNNPHNCRARQYECVCRSVAIPTEGGCDQLIQIFDMSAAALSFNIFGFVSTLVATIMAGSALKGFSAGTTGIVMQTYQTPQATTVSNPYTSTTGTVLQTYPRPQATTFPNPSVVEAGFVKSPYPQTGLRL